MAEAQVMRRWRGEIDVPLSSGEGEKIKALRRRLDEAGGLLVCYHDWLSRCKNTAKILCPINNQIHSGVRPWRMGPKFEGHPITPESVRHAQWLAEHPHEVPIGGEPFIEWYDEWMTWLRMMADSEWRPIGAVTHNRNIQAAYSTVEGKFVPDLYNVEGPDFLSVHMFRGRQITPWSGEPLLRGAVYLVRHGRTDWGT